MDNTNTSLEVGLWVDALHCMDLVACGDINIQSGMHFLLKG